jgi:hypothetical protein
MVAVRKQLLKDRAGDLGPEDFIVHAPDLKNKMAGTPS